MKKIVISILCAALVLSLPMGALAIGMDSFEKTREYQGEFVDLRGKWSEAYVADLYEYGLVEGRTPTTMEPDAPISLAEVITMAARINAVYYEREIPGPAEEEEWYDPYVAYALEQGIISEALSYNVTWDAERGDTALIFASALIPEQYEAINKEKTFFDVKPLDKYFEAVSRLTRAGIVTGYEDMSYRPAAGVTRAEAMVMADRLVNKEQRINEHVPTNNSGAFGKDPAEEPADGIEPGSRDEEVGDYVTFYCKGVGVFNMNRRDEGFLMTVSAGEGTLLVAGQCEMRGNYLLCHLGERVAQGEVGADAATNAATLLFTYDNGVRMTLLYAADAKGNPIVSTAKVLGDLAYGDVFKATK